MENQNETELKFDGYAVAIMDQSGVFVRSAIFSAN